MKGSIRFCLMALGPCAAGAAAEPVALDELTVYSNRVANQLPAGTFAMPVSTLRYEPSVDIHPRNLAEGQADITIRGGIFENTGFQVGAVTVGDPQTGHYLAELPLAPAMLTAPRLVTGAALAQGPANATSGGVVYGWREVRTAGWAAGGWGEDGLRRGELYQGVVRELAAGRRIGAQLRMELLLTLRRGESVLLVPGGQQEMIESRSGAGETRVVTKHVGFIRLAMQEGVPLVPVLSLGEVEVLDFVRLPSLQRFFIKRIGIPVPFLPYGARRNPP